MTEDVKTKLFLSTVFLTGAAVLIIEVSAVRILTPYFGSSLHVLSSVLTVVLLGLSLGYWHGGKRADKNHEINDLYRIITLSGLATLALYLLTKLLLPLGGYALPPQMGSLFFSLVFFFAPAFLLGIVSPYIIKLQTIGADPNELGSLIGLNFFWGTLGSIIGSLSAGYLLVPHLGITLTMSLTGLMLVILGISIPTLITKHWRVPKNLVFLILGIVLATACLNVERKHNAIYQAEGLYSQIRVQDTLINGKVVRLLMRDQNISSAIYLQSTNPVPAYINFSLFLDKLVDEPKDVLVLGGGAYTAPRGLSERYPDLNIDVVELEPSLYELAQEYFFLSPESKITNYSMDARVFLNRNPDKKYDMIFSDLFSTDQATPFHLTTIEFYDLLSSHLNDDGILMVNSFGINREYEASMPGTVTKTISSIFPNTRVFAMGDVEEDKKNYVLVSRNSGLEIGINNWNLYALKDPVTEVSVDSLINSQDKPLLDDKAPIEYLANKHW